MDSGFHKCRRHITEVLYDRGRHSTNGRHISTRMTLKVCFDITLTMQFEITLPRIKEVSMVICAIIG